ncbi:hypothetical protein Mapa_013173 [Marchantia paleacea]|nr:hypothetical protein Mapa_013173 [Marchantia paleacea]
MTPCIPLSVETAPHALLSFALLYSPYIFSGSVPGLEVKYDTLAYRTVFYLEIPFGDTAL